MVSRADIHLVGVENRRNVVRVHTLNREGENAVVFLAALRSEHSEVRNCGEFLHRETAEVRFALQNRIPAELLIVVDCRTDADRTAHIDGARLKLVRELCPGRLLAAHIFNHLAAEQEGRHREQKIPLAVEDADAHRSQHLVAGKREKIHIEVGHIDRNVRHGLRAVQNEQAAVLVRKARKGLHVVFDAEHIRDVRHRDEFRLRTQHTAEIFFRDITLFVRLEEL